MQRAQLVDWTAGGEPGAHQQGGMALQRVLCRGLSPGHGIGLRVGRCHETRSASAQGTEGRTRRIVNRHNIHCWHDTWWPVHLGLAGVGGRPHLMLQYGMARATRTLNPLHFEDLEPHRFEDLVRQLAYDYRPWASIEATGRGGADDGIDIRAFEQGIVPSFEEADEEDLPPLVASRRLWILQCKREKRIGPAQVRRYVEESVPGPEVPYGFILAAACDFSKKAYDAFRAALIGTGVQEFHLWGKAELEDMLFQPKNDHLLFAYFGISLQTRKRSKQNELRSLLTWRKRILRALDSERGVIGQDVLLLDADCQDYPLMDEVPDFETAQPWGIFRVKLMHPQHFLVLEVARHLAYADD